MNTNKPFESNIESFIKSAMQKHQGGQFDEAELIYRQILETQAEDEDRKTSLGKLYYTIILNLGDVLQKQGKSKAVAYYRQAIAIQPDLVDAHYNLGEVLQQLGDFKEAIACYQTALELNPQHQQAYINLGQIITVNNNQFCL